MSRPLAVVSALALVSFASHARGDSAPFVRESNAGVHFESGRSDTPPPGVTFTPGATLAESDARAAAPAANESHPAEPVVSVATVVAVTSDSHANATIESPTRAVERDATPAPPPSTTGESRAITAPIAVGDASRAHVARTSATRAPESPRENAVCRAPQGTRHLALEGTGLRATHIALAADDERVVALVSMARPAPARHVHEGLVYPEGRLVIDDGNEARVVPTIGTEPDTAIALLTHDRIAVVGYERLDGEAREAHRESAITVAILDAAGRTVVPMRRFAATAGLHIDSSVVRHGDGFAVILGRESTPDDGSRGPVRESLYVFDANGAIAHEPVTVTDEQSADTLATHRVGLASGNDGDLRATWSVTTGAHVGVWTARITGTRLAAPLRLLDRVAWGSEVSGDGNGAFFRSGGERGEPVGLFYRAFDAGSRVIALGAGWDPSVTVSRGWWLVAGVALQRPDGAALESVVAAARAGQPLQAVVTPEVGEAALSEAVDLDMVGTRNGAAIAWIEAAESGNARRLGLARVTCP
jgi:hypothetical protein